MTLIEAVQNLDSLEGESTIYAAQPWTADSMAVVAPEPESGGLPTEAEKHALKYFLEVSIARDFLEDWSANLDAEPILQEKCARLIQYAITDA
ncbi:hypothetical protein V1294_006797 [Bradyrhizobium sp. AZCC 1678]|uniref:hypothetical protein n=1 Tax=Bradyrhizobium sp. AZCC 1678 TaxID=3117030 RepID=UPI002FF2474B